MAESRISEADPSAGFATRLRTLLRFTIPYDASVAIASEGEPSYLLLEGRRAEHFPQTPTGVYSGSYPGTDLELITQVDALHDKGIQFLVFPATTGWWLDHYEALRHHLTRRYRLVHRETQTAVVYALHDLADAQSRRFGAPDNLPIPAPEMMALTTSVYDARHFFESGKQGAEAVTRIFRTTGRDPNRADSLLDYGCGCGRILRHWQAADTRFIAGTDYNPFFVDFLRKTLPFAQVKLSTPETPVPFEDGSFELIYGISVLTHLDEAAQNAAVADLVRVLQPQGVLLLTVHGESRVGGLSPDERRLFNEGVMVVRTPEVSGSNACITWHPPSYINEWLGRYFTSVEVVPDGAPDVRQDVVLLAGPRKRRPRR